MCGEAYVLPLSFMALWVRPDEFHQTFNFRFLDAGWDREKLISAIDESFEAFDGAGAPSTWVLNNHDVLRHVSRFGGDYGRTTASDGVGPNNPQPDNVLGLRKARAATLFMLALPGASYLYQGEELGLPDHTTIADEHRQDPTFFRTGGQRVGRDGCRVPLPWEMGNAANGFNQTGKAWLPQPNSYAELSRDQQVGKPESTLTMYQRALKLRSELKLGEGSFDWVNQDEVLIYQNGNLRVVHNFSNQAVKLDGEVLLSSMPLAAGSLLPNDTAWVLV
jgi:alpha-glucosidase